MEGDERQREAAFQLARRQGKLNFDARSRLKLLDSNHSNYWTNAFVTFRSHRTRRDTRRRWLTTCHRRAPKGARRRRIRMLQRGVCIATFDSNSLCPTHSTNLVLFFSHSSKCVLLVLCRRETEGESRSAGCQCWWHRQGARYQVEECSR